MVFPFSSSHLTVNGILRLWGFDLWVKLHVLDSFSLKWSVLEFTTIGTTYPHPTFTMHFPNIMALIYLRTSRVSILCVLWGLLILSFHLVVFDNQDRSRTDLMVESSLEFLHQNLLTLIYSLLIYDSSLIQLSIMLLLQIWRLRFNPSQSLTSPQFDGCHDLYGILIDGWHIFRL